jgi:hypothetical protein
MTPLMASLSIVSVSFLLATGVVAAAFVTTTATASFTSVPFIEEYLFKIGNALDEPSSCGSL